MLNIRETQEPCQPRRHEHIQIQEQILTSHEKTQKSVVSMTAAITSPCSKAVYADRSIQAARTPTHIHQEVLKSCACVASQAFQHRSTQACSSFPLQFDQYMLTLQGLHMQDAHKYRTLTHSDLADGDCRTQYDRAPRYHRAMG